MDYFADDMIALATKALEVCRRKDLKLGTVESCTGGLISAELTEIAGSSDVMIGGLATYSNQAKIDLAHVKPETLQNFGAVSKETAVEMAEGGAQALKTDITVAVTGIAGPGGGSVNKPVGTVHLACARRGYTTVHEQCKFAGNRSDVRQQAIQKALRMIIAAASH